MSPPAVRLLAIVLVLSGTGGAAHAACPQRIGVAYGDTLTSIAAGCGVSIDALRKANPGLNAETLRAGTFISIPEPVMRSRQIEIGQPSIRIAPQLVPPATGGASPTVILPPQPLPVPQQHILRGFGDELGQLPLPPGHSIRIP